MSEPRRVRLRPHHFMCVHGFKGHGYSPEFVKNFWSLIDTLSDDNTEVETVAGTQDYICGPCPNNRGTVCADEAKIKKLDDAWAATLKIKPTDVMSWREAKKLVATLPTDAEFDRNCEPCAWRKLGVCKEALQRMRAAGSTNNLKSLMLAVLVGLTFATGSARAEGAAEEQPLPQQPNAPIVFSPQPATPAPAPAPSTVVTPAAAQASGAAPIALPSPTPGPEAVDTSKFTTVDQLEAQLLFDKTRRLPAILKVQTALNNQEWKKALDAAKPLDGMAEWADYYHYLLGEAELGRMHRFMLDHSSATALIAGEQAKFHFSQVLAMNPLTTVWKRAGAHLGEVELAMGEVTLRAHHRAKAQSYFESGFQRLSQMGMLAVVPKVTIVSYALLCERAKTDLCTSWVAKLAPFVTKTEEARILDRVTAFKRRYIERTPTQPYKVDLDLQAFTKGFQSYQEGKFEDAYGTWRDLLRDYPRTTIKLRTKFWMGRAAQRSQHTAQAETHFREIIKELPFSYYALLAGWFGGIDLSRMMDAELPVATAETPLLTPADIVHIRRAELLISSAVPELAQLELGDVHASANMPNEFLVYLVMLNNLAGNHQAAFQMLGELSSRNFSGLFSVYGQKLYFPTARLPLVRSLAKEWKVEPLLVLSVIKQESAFNDQAVSGASAYGLMQLIGPTARELDRSVDVADLFNAATNVKLGTRYIHQLLSRFHGNVILALAAYNSGPHNADRWLRDAPPNAPLEEFIETISFRETREYVQNILRNYYWYSRRIKGNNAANLMALTQDISPWTPSKPGSSRGSSGSSGHHASLKH